MQDKQRHRLINANDLEKYVVIRDGQKWRGPKHDKAGDADG